MKLRKFAACTMSILLIASTIAACSSEADNKKTDTGTKDNNSSSASQTGTGEGYGTKEETVYVTTAADGTVQKILVSDWLQNSDGYATLKDITNLSDIVNAKGNEAFTESNGQITFNAAGKDIYYQGQLSKDTRLPVGIKVTYTLDGEEISADALEGKSGKVLIKIEYTANETTKVSINNEEKDVYVPFLAVTGMLLPTEQFTNIQVTNGEVMSNGDYNIVMGMGIPGISESLGVDIPNCVEITADVKDYSVDVMMTVCTNKIFNNISLDDLDSVNDITDMISLLSESSTKLSDGAAALNEGLTQLQSSAETLSSGVAKLNAGAASLNDGLQTLNSGAIDVNNGVSKLTSSMTQMIKTISTTIADNNTQITQLKGNISTYNTEISKLQANLTTYNGEITKLQQQAAAVNTAVTAGQMTQAAADATLSQLNAGIAKYQAAIEQTNSGITQYQSGIEQTTAGINQLTGANKALQTILDQMTAKDADGKTLSDNLASLSAGTQAIADGSTKLSAGATDLANGLAELNSKIPALTEGINKLAAGAGELNTGMSQFNESAIQKIADVYNNDFAAVLDDVKAVINAGKTYSTLTGLGDNASGTATFIIKTN